MRVQLSQSYALKGVEKGLVILLSEGPLKIAEFRLKLLPEVALKSQACTCINALGMHRTISNNRVVLYWGELEKIPKHDNLKAAKRPVRLGASGTDLRVDQVQHLCRYHGNFVEYNAGEAALEP